MSDPTGTPSTDGAPDPKHTIGLANIDRGTPEWRLHCHHGADEFRCYTETGEVDPLHEGECVLADWWDEYGIELVDIREPISALPIPVDANWSGDSWDLTLAAAGLRVVPEDRPGQCPRCGSDRRSHRVKTTPRTHCGHEWHVEPAGVPALDDDTRREVEALVERVKDRKVAYEVSREYGIPLPLDHIDMSRMERMAELLAAAYLGGTDGR